MPRSGPDYSAAPEPPLKVCAIQVTTKWWEPRGGSLEPITVSLDYCLGVRTLAYGYVGPFGRERGGGSVHIGALHGNLNAVKDAVWASPCRIA
jgi:hypothetical protein